MDTLDLDILQYIKDGKTNAYQVWRAMDEQSNGNVMAYVNLRKRVKSLSDACLIEQLKITGITIHGRIDYRISNKGKLAIRQCIRQLEDLLK